MVAEISSGGGGVIQVTPSSLEDMAQAIAGLAAQTSSVRGSFGGASGASGACDPRASGACSAMFEAWIGGLAGLQQITSEFGGRTGTAGMLYAQADAAAMDGAGAVGPALGGP